MAECTHGHAPAHLCGICNKERQHMQFGGIYAGEVGLNLKGKKSVKINMDETPEEREQKELQDEEHMKKHIIHSFGPVAKKPVEKIDE